MSKFTAFVHIYGNYVEAIEIDCVIKGKGFYSTGNRGQFLRHEMVVMDIPENQDAINAYKQREEEVRKIVGELDIELHNMRKKLPWVRA